MADDWQVEYVMIAFLSIEGKPVELEAAVYNEAEAKALIRTVFREGLEWVRPDREENTDTVEWIPPHRILRALYDRPMQLKDDDD